MVKKSLSDMVPRNQPRTKPKFQPQPQQKEKNNESYEVVDFTSKKTSKESRNSLWIVALVSIIFLFFASSSIFAKAQIEVYPKTKELSLNNTFSAVKDSSSDGVLPFSIVSLSGEESKTLETSEVKDTDQKATGKVMLYNNFSTTPQKLAKDTRLVATNGKIYKTETEVVIPGMQKVDQQKVVKENTPGSVEVNIYAEESGDEYNSAPTDFKILGFKNSQKYNYFYGRSKGDITGGLKGTFNFISLDDKAKAEEELTATLESELLKKIIKEIPPGYILFKNATVFKIDDDNVNLASKDKEVPFVLQGTLYGFLFEEKSLTAKIVGAIIPDYDNSDVYISNINDLVFTVTIPPGTVSYLDLKSIDFSLSGTPKIVWRVDKQKLIEALLSKSKSDFNQVLSSFTNIDKASLTLRPIWSTSIPSKSKDIEVIINY